MTSNHDGKYWAREAIGSLLELAEQPTHDGNVVCDIVNSLGIVLDEIDRRVGTIEAHARSLDGVHGDTIRGQAAEARRIVDAARSELRAPKAKAVA